MGRRFEERRIGGSFGGYSLARRAGWRSVQRMLDAIVLLVVLVVGVPIAVAVLFAGLAGLMGLAINVAAIARMVVDAVSVIPAVCTVLRRRFRTTGFRLGGDS